MNLSGTDPKIIYGILNWFIGFWDAPEHHTGAFRSPFSHSRHWSFLLLHERYQHSKENRTFRVGFGLFKVTQGSFTVCEHALNFSLMTLMMFDTNEMLNEAKARGQVLETTFTHTHTFSTQQHINAHAKALKTVHVTLSRAGREPSSVTVPSHSTIRLAMMKYCYLLFKWIHQGCCCWIKLT